MLTKLLFFLFSIPLFIGAQTTLGNIEVSKFSPLGENEKLGYEIVINTRPKYTNTLTITAIDSLNKSTRFVGSFNDVEFIYYQTNTIQGLEFSYDRTMCVIRSMVGNSGNVYSLILVNGKVGTIKKIAEGHIFFSRLSSDGRYLVYAPDSSTSGNPLEFKIFCTQSKRIVCNLLWPNKIEDNFTQVSFRRFAGSNNLLVLKDEDFLVVEVSILDFSDFSLHDVTDNYIKQSEYLNRFDPIWQDSVMTDRIGTIIYK